MKCPRCYSRNITPSVYLSPTEALNAKCSDCGHRWASAQTPPDVPAAQASNNLEKHADSMQEAAAIIENALYKLELLIERFKAAQQNQSAAQRSTRQQGQVKGLVDYYGNKQ